MKKLILLSIFVSSFAVADTCGKGLTGIFPAAQANGICGKINTPTIATPTLSGDVTLSTGNLVVSTSTKGVVLPIGTVAAIGSIQGDAAAIPGPVSTVTAADGTKGVYLPSTPVVGQLYKVINTAAAVLKIYPGTGDTINATAANTAVSVAASVVTDCIPVSTAAWWCSEGVAP